MIKNPNSQAALDIARGIKHDQAINPTWSPTDSQIEFRIREYLEGGDPRIAYDRDRIMTLIKFAIS
jgi:hypothetical protein